MPFLLGKTAPLEALEHKPQGAFRKMELINNINKTLRDDLMQQIKPDSRLSIAATCFSIYAYQELKEALKDIKELRFIFTSPTFTTEKTPKQQREFYIPRLDRERTLYGSEFEVKLRNELTQRAIARECAEWIRQKVCFKSNRTNEQMMGFITLDDNSYSPLDGFTTVDLGCEKGNHAYTMIQKSEAPFSKAYIDLFNQLWNDSARMQVVTDEVIDSIGNAYKENAPEFLYFVALYNIFNEFWKTSARTSCPTRPLDSRTPLFGTNSITSSVMPPWPSSISWRSTMVASLPTP